MRLNNRRSFIKTLGLGIGALALPGFSRVSTRRPNILYIMSDDHAAHAIGCYGSRLATLNPTPNIDKLAKEGIRLDNCFCTNSICVPSRATIITGQYSHTNEITTLNGALEPDRQYLPILMKKNGYETAMIGKWHLKTEPAPFDYYCVLPGQGNYFNPIMREKGKGVWPDNEHRFAGYDSKHSSDVITNLSLDWLKRRDKNNPFFLMHHFKAPHDNFENAERYDWIYQDETIPEPPSLWQRGNHGPIDKSLFGTSVSKRNKRRNMGHHMFVDQDVPKPVYTRTAYQRYLKKFLRCVKGVDDNIGRLIDYLKSTGELDQTIIIYTADQGFMLGEHDYIDKRWMYEESLRMPFIVRYPNWIKPDSSTKTIVNNADFMPTLLDMASIKIPDNVQGKSFLPILKGRPVPDDWPDATYYRYWMHMAHHDNPAHYGIRTRDYKLIFFYGLPLDAPGALPDPTQPYWELYDLHKDPKEMNNVYDDPNYQQVVVELKDKLLELKTRVGDRDEKYPELMEIREKYW